MFRFILVGDWIGLDWLDSLRFIILRELEVGDFCIYWLDVVRGLHGNKTNHHQVPTPPPGGKKCNELLVSGCSTVIRGRCDGGGWTGRLCDLIHDKTCDVVVLASLKMWWWILYYHEMVNEVMIPGFFILVCGGNMTRHLFIVSFASYLIYIMFLKIYIVVVVLRSTT